MSPLKTAEDYVKDLRLLPKCSTDSDILWFLFCLNINTNLR